MRFPVDGMWRFGRYLKTPCVTATLRHGEIVSSPSFATRPTKIVRRHQSYPRCRRGSVFRLCVVQAFRPAPRQPRRKPPKGPLERLADAEKEAASRLARTRLERHAVIDSKHEPWHP